METMALDSLSPDVLAAAIEGDDGALQHVAAAALPAVLQWCARLGEFHVDPEDAAHDVMLIMVRKIHHIEDPSRFRGWLFGVTRNVLRNHRRKSWFRRWFAGRHPEPVEPSPSALAKLNAGRRAKQVLQILDALPESQREVLVLCDMEGRSSGEVAEVAGVPLGTVKSRLRLARRRFASEANRRKLAQDLFAAERLI